VPLSTRVAHVRALLTANRSPPSGTVRASQAICMIAGGNRPLAFLAGAFLLLGAATQCTSSTPDSSESPATGDTAGQVPVDKNGEPVSVACTTASDCPLPPSQCESTSSLGYYTNPQCVAGQCRWQHQTMSCPCYVNGCQFTTTTSAAPIEVGGQGGQADEGNMQPEGGEMPDAHQGDGAESDDSCSDKDASDGACWVDAAGDR
jgi:hypothetical protein